MEISKELLSEVLSYKLSYKIKVHKIIVRTGTLNYFYNIKDSYGGLFEANAYINVYELAFKCKEWASELDYEMESATYRYNKGGYCFVSTFLNNTRFEARTEVEAIIKACEYILKELNEKQLQH